jgi:pilus assembly protein Flp/PilA
VFAICSFWGGAPFENCEGSLWAPAACDAITGPPFTERLALIAEKGASTGEAMNESAAPSLVVSRRAVPEIKAQNVPIYFTGSQDRIGIFPRGTAGGQQGVRSMRQLVSAFLKDESGATAIEYGLIAAGISVVIIATVQGVGTNMKTTFGSVQTALK